MAHNRKKMIRLAKRLLTHNLNGTTDQADAIMIKSVSDYTDKEIIQNQVDTIFNNYPLPLALTIELPEKGTYKTLDVLNTPILLTRSSDGVVRAFVNVCKHRGAPVCEKGKGKKSKFSCTYHGWTYDNRGKLINIFQSDTFGEIDKTKIKLTELFCEERSGFIWVCINPDSKPNLSNWLQGFDEEINEIGLDSWYLYEQRILDGPSWKICWDGYLDGYHHHMVHPETVGKNTIVNLIAHDTYGPHQRFAFGKKNINELQKVDEVNWEPEEYIRLIHSGFPNLSISAILNQFCLVSMIYPTKDLEKTITIQNILSLNKPSTKEEIKAAEEFSELTLKAVKDEDYIMNFKIQDGINSKGNDKFMFGKNEPIQQHYHNWIDKLCGH
tara:strand:+ start:5373 stop:6521 length:1149 start_codon:yes stop_codon:yes gene_type:complete